MSLAATLRRKAGGFAGKSFASLLVKVGGAFASYVFFLAFARTLGPVAFGVFAFILSAANFGMLAASFGQPMLTLRNLSYALAADREAEARGALRFGLRLSLYGAALGVLGLGLFGLIAPRFGAPGEIGAYVAGAALLVALLAAEFLSHLLRAFGAVTMALLPRDLLWRAIALGAAFGLAVVAPGYGVATALWLNVAVLGALVLWQALYGRRLAPAWLRAGPEPEARDLPLADWRRSSLHFWGIAVAAGLAQHLTVVAVGFAAPPEQIGAFFAAFRTASLLSMPLTAANIVLAPMLARYHREGRRDLTQKVILEFITLISIPTLAGTLALLLWGGRVLDLFDPAYGAAQPALAIFALGFLFNTLTGPCGYVMMMSGAEAAYLRYTIVANLAAVIGAGVAIHFGMSWAAAAIALANMGQNIAAALWSRRHAGVESTILCLWSRPSG